MRRFVGRCILAVAVLLSVGLAAPRNTADASPRGLVVFCYSSVPSGEMLWEYGVMVFEGADVADWVKLCISEGGTPRVAKF